MMTQIGEATVERKHCLDKMSCYEARMKTAQQSLSVFLDPEKTPCTKTTSGSLRLHLILALMPKDMLRQGSAQTNWQPF